MLKSHARIGGLLSVDLRRMLTQKLFYIMLGVSAVLPVLILVMTTAFGSTETMKTEFFSNVSREMKAPLAVLSSSLELIDGGRLSPEEERLQLNTARSAAQRMNGLIENLLKLNKLENQTIVPKTESYDVCAQLCECVIDFEALLEEKHIDFEAQLDDEAWVRADGELMRLYGITCSRTRSSLRRTEQVL